MKYILYSFLLINIASCGFTPIYNNNEIYTNLTAIKVEDINGEIGFKLKSKIEESLNPLISNNDVNYSLSINLNKVTSPLAIQRDNYAIRYNMTITADYKLLKIDNQQIIDQGSINMITSYNAGAPFANFVSEENAENNNLIELASEIKRRLILVLYQS